MNQSAVSFSLQKHWRHLLLLVFAIGSLVAVYSVPPILQDQAYHDFADARTILGVPNGLNVVSNLPFILVGLAGIRRCVKIPSEDARGPWIGFFIGVAFVGAGSTCYHLAPQNRALVWDRIPMAMAFMGLIVAFLNEFVDGRAQKFLTSALLLGLSSVLWWYWTGDLRLYVWVQFVAFAAIPMVMLLFRSRYSDRGYFLLAGGFYFLAKVFEQMDRQVFSLTGQWFSGHSLKHLAAATGCFVLLRMLKKRKVLAGLG